MARTAVPLAAGALMGSSFGSIVLSPVVFILKPVLLRPMAVMLKLQPPYSSLHASILIIVLLTLLWGSSIEHLTHPPCFNHPN